MKRLVKNILYNLKLNRKFLIVYICCVIIPLVVTDSLVFYGLYSAELNERRHDRENEALSYQNLIINSIEYDSIIARAASANRSLNAFLERDYRDGYNYLEAYFNFKENSFFNTIQGLKSDNIVVYADNSTIKNGGLFQSMAKNRLKNEEWYQRFLETGKDEAVLVFYDNGENVSIGKRRRFIYVKRMKDYLYESDMEKIITIENDANKLSLEIKQLPSNCPMYMCCGDYCVFSNKGDNISYSDVMERLDGDPENNHTVKTFRYLNSEFVIYVFNDDLTLSSVISQRFGIILALLIFTILFPILTMKVIERSITSRVSVLNNAFEGDENGAFKPISSIQGSDELALLMENYNRIVTINNNLINTVYKDKLREQENDIARKNAELLALQSQINPHFLFNALESIRMHSMLKGEDETAEMVEKLAFMERQNVEWEHDAVPIRKELEFIRAYLALQSYRFGDRLSFDIDIDKDCENILIPKLTLTTFVENACVHGIESKSSQGWIFVRVYEAGEQLCIEVEDTGDGMNEKEVAALSKSINSIDIETLKTKKRVGILNACLRIKMMFDNKVDFIIDSEKGIGFSVLIKIPMELIKKQE